MFTVKNQRSEELKQTIKELEQQLKQRELSENSQKKYILLLDVLLNTIPNPIYYQDSIGVLQGCNLSFADTIIGRPREKILGESMKDLYTQTDKRLQENLFRQPIESSSKKDALPIQVNIQCADDQNREFLISKAIIVDPVGKFSGSVGVMIDITERKKAEAQKEKLIKELQESLATVKTLRGLIPICSHCKNIRDDKGYWNQIEGYIQKHSDAQFSHGMCPECSDELYGKEDWYIEMKNKKGKM